MMIIIMNYKDTRSVNVCRDVFMRTISYPATRDI